MENINQNEKDFVTLKKKYVNPLGVQTIFANEMTVSHTSNEFFLSFYRLEPPIVLDEEDKAELLKMDSLDAVLVTKIAITPEFAEATLEALKINIEKFKEIKKNDNVDDSK